MNILEMQLKYKILRVKNDQHYGINIGTCCVYGEKDEIHFIFPCVTLKDIRFNYAAELQNHTLEQIKLFMLQITVNKLKNTLSM